MRVYKRENYLKKIRGFYHDTGLIKVITGVRRCGKSCLMESIVAELAGTVPKKNILQINLDKRGFTNVTTPEQLDDLLKPMLKKAGTKYVFIDEVQNVKNFEQVLNAYREEGDFSIFVTGSNSYLLSGEMVTKLTGRYLEFEVFPLTFDEYLGMKKFLKQTVGDVTGEFERFLREGGFPKALTYADEDNKRMYVQGIIGEIFAKDIRRRVKVKNTVAFEQVQRYIINNFGSTVSMRNILQDLHKAGSNIRPETLNRYLKILTDAKILYRCDRFDLKTRRSMSGEQKYYLADLGFYYSTNTDNRINYGPVLENVVYTYARAKGYNVSIGKIGLLECDFILRRGSGDYVYLQVAMTIENSMDTENREYAPLEMIKDNYPKYVLTRNDLIQRRNGIIHVNLADFMQNGKLF